MLQLTIIIKLYKSRGLEATIETTTLLFRVPIFIYTSTEFKVVILRNIFTNCADNHIKIILSKISDNSFILFRTCAGGLFITLDPE
jgi:hypothetical protein